MKCTLKRNLNLSHVLIKHKSHFSFEYWRLWSSPGLWTYLGLYVLCNALMNYFVLSQIHFSLDTRAKEKRLYLAVRGSQQQGNTKLLMWSVRGSALKKKTKKNTTRCHLSGSMKQHSSSWRGPEWLSGLISAGRMGGRVVCCLITLRLQVFSMLRCPRCFGTEKTEDRDQTHLVHLAGRDGGHAGKHSCSE